MQKQVLLSYVKKQKKITILGDIVGECSGTFKSFKTLAFFALDSFDLL